VKMKKRLSKAEKKEHRRKTLQKYHQSPKYKKVKARYVAKAGPVAIRTYHREYYHKELKNSSTYKAKRKLYAQKPYVRLASCMYQRVYSKTPKCLNRMHTYYCSALYKKQNKLWRDLPANKLKTAIRGLDWRMSDYGRSYKRQWNSARRRSINVIEFVSKEKLLKLHNYRCVYCGKLLHNDKFTHIDHLIAVARYQKLGRLCPESYATVVPACVECNRHKSTKTPLEFIWARAAA